MKIVKVYKHIKDKGPCNVAQICKDLSLYRNSVSTMIDTMVGMGIIEIVKETKNSKFYDLTNIEVKRLYEIPKEVLDACKDLKVHLEKEYCDDCETKTCESEGVCNIKQAMDACDKLVKDEKGMDK